MGRIILSNIREGGFVMNIRPSAAIRQNYNEIAGEGKYRVLSCDCEGPDGDPCVGAGGW